MSYERLVVVESDRGAVLETLYKMSIIDFRKSRAELPDDRPDARFSQVYMMMNSIGKAMEVLPQRKIVPEKQLGTEELLKAAQVEFEAAEEVKHLVERRGMIISEISAYGDTKEYSREKVMKEDELSIVHEALRNISDAHYSRMANIREMLGIEYGKENVVEMFKTTGHACVMEGWVPKNRLHELREAVAKATSGRYYMESVKTDELQPTYFNQPGLLKSFEFIINTYSTPRSDEINPAWLFMISFPVFFGLMVSDAGYGLVSWIIGFVIAKRTPEDSMWHSLAAIWQLAAMFTILFGVINNQYFGFGLDQYIFPSFRGFDWAHNIQTVGVIALLVGLAQVCLGLGVAFINNYKHKRIRIAVSKLLLIIILLSGTIAVAGLLFGVFSGPITNVATYLAVICVISVLVIKPSQSGRIYDLVIYPISYVRIMGFGITSVLLASVINEIFTPNIDSGIALFVLYAFVLVVLHLVNLAMSTFEGAIQGARLNFIEFFEEFYTGGGVKYEPFSYKRVYTKE